MNLFRRGLGKGPIAIFILVLVISFTVPLYPVETVDDGESNSQGVALAENCLPSVNEAGAKGVQVQFDALVKSEESMSEEVGNEDNLSKLNRLKQ